MKLRFFLLITLSFPYFSSAYYMGGNDYICQMAMHAGRTGQRSSKKGKDCTSLDCLNKAVEETEDEIETEVDHLKNDLEDLKERLKKDIKCSTDPSKEIKKRKIINDIKEHMESEDSEPSTPFKCEITTNVTVLDRYRHIHPLSFIIQKSYAEQDISRRVMNADENVIKLVASTEGQDSTETGEPDSTETGEPDSTETGGPDSQRDPASTPCENELCEYKKYFEDEGEIDREGFCDDEKFVKVKVKKDCKSDLKSIEEIIKIINELEEKLKELESEAKDKERFCRRNEDHRDCISEDSRTEMGAFCIECAEEVFERFQVKKSGWQKFGEALVPILGAGLGYYGIKEANKLRVAQGYEADNSLALQLAFPFVMKGLYGAGLGGRGSGAFACSPTMGGYHQGYGGFGYGGFPGFGGNFGGGFPGYGGFPGFGGRIGFNPGFGGGPFGGGAFPGFGATGYFGGGPFGGGAFPGFGATGYFGGGPFGGGAFPGFGATGYFGGGNFGGGPFGGGPFGGGAFPGFGATGYFGGGPFGGGPFGGGPFGGGPFGGIGAGIQQSGQFQLQQRLMAVYLEEQQMIMRQNAARQSAIARILQERNQLDIQIQTLTYGGFGDYTARGTVRSSGGVGDR